MNHAGTPATPGRQTPRLLSTSDRNPAPTGPQTPAPVPAETTTHAPGPGPMVDSPFARLTATATYRLPDSTHPARRRDDGDWHHPDPASGLALGPGATPYDRALRRWAHGKSRYNAASKLRMVLRILAGSDEVDVSVDALRAFPWHQLTVEAAQDFHAAVTARYRTQASRNDMVCVLRTVIRECYQVRLISALRRELLLEALYTLAPGRSHRRHRITDVEFDRLMDACLGTGTEFVRARNSAIIALFRTTGLRVSELVHLDLADWNRREDVLLLTRTKNNDPHTLFLHPATKALLLQWLEVRGDRPGRLFHGVHASPADPMHTTSIRDMLSKRCRTAGIETFGTHDFRRTFATEMLRRHDAALVSKLLNHRKLASTLIYDMATEDEMRHAIGSLNLTTRKIDGAA